jgi:hypothetical protein
LVQHLLDGDIDAVMTRRVPCNFNVDGIIREYQLDSQPEKARDHYYHDYDADDVEDVHCHAPGELVITLVRDDTTISGRPEEFRFYFTNALTA